MAWMRTPALTGATRALCAGAAALALAGAAAAQEAAGPDYRTWDSFQGGADSSQYSSLDQIDRDNVGQLELAWTFPTDDRGPLFNPLIVGRTMIVLADSAFVALDAATGDEIWRHENGGRVGPRGLNYWESPDGSDRRLVFADSGFLTAIDFDTGETIASFGEDGFVDLRTGFEDALMASTQPLQPSNSGRIAGDVVIMSLPASAFSYSSAPADIHAFDVRTGALKWVFHVIPRPGEPGRETWPDNDGAQWGGGQNWSGSTVDVERGIVFIPTGTARFDYYGGNRHGDNLYANTLLALDAETGERLWSQQLVHHDLWDYDLPVAPKLLTVRRDGREIAAVAQATKQGMVFVFDRETGEPIFPIEERPVPPSDVPGEQAAPTQPFSTLPPYARQSFTEADINPHLSEENQEKVRALLAASRNDGLFTPPSIQGTVQIPSHGGSATWSSVAVDPDHGLFYVMAFDLPAPLKLYPPGGASEPAPNADEDFVSYRPPGEFYIEDDGQLAIAPPWSTITAYDLNAGTVLWQVPNGGVSTLEEKGVHDVGAIAARGGPVVTAGGLMFIATATDYTLRARDVADGSTLWAYDLGAASEGIPAVYEVDGREYVVLPVGGQGQYTYNLGLPEHGPSQYMAFALPE